MSILLKYFELGSRDYIFVGIAWMGISNPWLPDAISLFMIIFFRTTLSPELTFIIGYSLLPFFVLCWIIALTDLLYSEKQRILLIPYLILAIISEFFFIYLLLKDPSLIGTFVSPFQIRWSLFMEIYLFIFLLIAVATGFLFAFKSIKSHSREVQIKGRFILIAFISFTVAATIETFGHLEPLTVVLTRSILIFSSIVFYLGFIFPTWLRKFILK